MALNPDKAEICANSFDLRELLMGVTPGQSQGKGEVSNPSSCNELVFGEDFEFAVSLWIFEMAYRRSFRLSFCTQKYEVWVCMWQIELGQSSKHFKVLFLRMSIERLLYDTKDGFSWR